MTPQSASAAATFTNHWAACDWCREGDPLWAAMNDQDAAIEAAGEKD
jgi:hypothetical protein